MTSVDGEVTRGLSLSAGNGRQNRISEKVYIRVVGCLISLKMSVFHLNYLFPLAKLLFSVNLFSFATYLKIPDDLAS